MKTRFLFLSFLFFLSANAQTFTTWTEDDGIPSNSCNDVTVDSDNVLWLATTGGCASFDGIEWVTYDVVNSGIISNNTLAIFAASDDRIWCGTNAGVSVFDGSSWISYTEDDGLIDDQVRSISEDESGKIWIGAGTGISAFDGTNWANFGTGEGIPFGGINEVMQDEALNMNFATGLSGMITQNTTGDLDFVTEDEGLISNRLRCLAEAPNGNIWVGTDEGISVLDDGEVVTQYTTMFELLPPDTLNPVEDILFDLTGNAWVSVYVDYLVTEGGVSVFDGFNWIQFDEEDGLAGPVVRKMAVDLDNCVWVTTSTGLTRICNLPIGISEKEQIDFSMYPNPANEFITVELPSLSDYSVSIYDATGRVLMNSFFSNSSQARLDVSDFASGFYLLEVSSEAGKASRVLVKK